MSKLIIGCVLLALLGSGHSIQVHSKIEATRRDLRQRSKRLSGHLARLQRISAQEEIDHDARASALVEVRNELTAKDWTTTLKTFFAKLKSSPPTEHQVEYAAYIITNFLQITLSVVGILTIVGAVTIAPPLLVFISLPLMAMSWFSGQAADKAELAVIALNIRNVMNQVNFQLIDTIISQELILTKGKKLAALTQTKKSVNEFLQSIEGDLAKDDELTKKAKERLDVTILVQKSVQDQIHRMSWLDTVIKTKEYKKLAKTYLELDDEINMLVSEISSMQARAHKVVEIKLGLDHASDQWKAATEKIGDIKGRFVDLYCKARFHLSKSSDEMFTMLEPYLEGDVLRRFRKVTETVKSAASLASTSTSFTISTLATEMDSLLEAGSILKDAIFVSYGIYDTTYKAKDAADMWDKIRNSTDAEWKVIKEGLLTEFKPVVAQTLQGTCANMTTDTGVPLFPTAVEANTFNKNGQPLNKDLPKKIATKTASTQTHTPKKS